MLKVDLIYMSDINAPNGASVLVKKLNDVHDSFFEKGVEQRVVAPSLPNTQLPETGINTNTKPSLIRRVVRFVSKYSVIVTYLRFYRSGMRLAEQIINQYEKIEDKGDVVVFHELLTCYAYLKRFRGNGQRVILTIHGNGEIWKMVYFGFPRMKSFVFYPYKKRITDIVFKHCDKIGFDADIPRKRFCATYARYEHKTFYAYNGIELRPCPNRGMASKLKMICIATLSDRKNQAGILNAIQLLSVDLQNKIEVIFVGDGNIRGLLEEKARSIHSKVTFMGSMVERDYNECLLNSNCFCLFSKDEGLPIAVIEGMRSGLPIIGSKVGGIPEEIIDGKSGFLVNLDERELSEKIKWMVEHVDSLDEMGHASYQHFVNNFTIEAMVRKYVEVYNCR